MDAYLQASGIEGEPLSPFFRSTIANGKLDSRPLSRTYAMLVIKRALDAPQPSNRIEPISPSLIDGIGRHSVVDLRDRAIIGVLHHTELKPSAVAALRVGHYVQQRGKYALRLTADRRIPVLPALVLILRDYLNAIGPVDKRRSLFFGEGNAPISARDIRGVIRRRSLASV
jgi:integrase